MSNLTPAQRVTIARHEGRPGVADYIEHLFTDFFEQKGDRQCREDPSILGGIALFQAFSGYIRPGNGLIGKTVAMFTMLLSSFRSSEGSIWRRFTDAIRYAEPLEMEKSPVDVPIFTLSAFSIIIIAAAIADCVFF